MAKKKPRAGARMQGNRVNESYTPPAQSIDGDGKLKLPDSIEQTIGDDVMPDVTAAPIPERFKRPIQPVPEPVGFTSVMNDPRKIRKATRESVTKNWNENRNSNIIGLMKTVVEKSRAATGIDGIYMASEAPPLVGIPCPLVIQWLLGLNRWPLGLIYHFAGRWQAHKSSLLYEVFRWFAVCGGGSYLTLTEDKITLANMFATMGYGHPSLHDQCPAAYGEAGNLQAGQKMTMEYITNMKAAMEGTVEDPGPGRVTPVCYGIDSLAGKLTEKATDDINSEGSATQQYPAEAKLNTAWFKTISGQLLHWPFCLIFINHLKEDLREQNPNGTAKLKTPGGAQANYSETFEFHLSRKRKPYGCAAWDAVDIEIECAKNNQARDGRTVVTRRLEMETMAPDGVVVQRLMWDWDWAAINLLFNLLPKQAARLKESGFHIMAKQQSQIENSCWSKTLGVSEKEPVSYAEMGRLLRQDAEALGIVQACLSIRPIPLLNDDYAKQQVELIL